MLFAKKLFFGKYKSVIKLWMVTIKGELKIYFAIKYSCKECRFTRKSIIKLNLLLWKNCFKTLNRLSLLKNPFDWFLSFPRFKTSPANSYSILSTTTTWCTLQLFFSKKIDNKAAQRSAPPVASWSVTIQILCCFFRERSIFDYFSNKYKQ